MSNEHYRNIALAALNSNGGVISVETPEQAHAWRQGFYRWRYRERRRGVTMYDEIQVSISPNRPLDCVLSLGPPFQIIFTPNAEDTTCP